MAVELMKFDKAQEEAERKSLADSIRAKGGTTAQMEWPDGFKAAVDAIQTGGGASEFASVPVYYVQEYNVETSVVEEVK